MERQNRAPEPGVPGRLAPSGSIVKLLAARREAWSATLPAVDWEPRMSAIRFNPPDHGVVFVLTERPVSLSPARLAARRSEEGNEDG
jgi:hypothetical protein